MNKVNRKRIIKWNNELKDIIQSTKEVTDKWRKSKK